VQPYSPERRTALVFCGTGAHGAYHAGVLRALQEAGVKVDVVAGHGIGAASAALAAIDGGSRLWDENGWWRGGATRALYNWRWPLRALPFVAGALVVSCLAVAVWPQPMPWLVRWLPLLALAASPGLIGIAIWMDGRRTARRRASGAWFWRVAGAPLDAGAAKDLLVSTVWQLVRGGDQNDRPAPAAAGRRYVEVLAENMGQPGFRELVVIASDLDSRRDVVAALLKEPHRREFMLQRGDRERRADVMDLAGVGRDHALDVVAGAISPVGCESHFVTFGLDSYWRGETHRLCDRPGGVSRLLEELAVAGVSQAVIVSAVAAAPAPHQLSIPRLDMRGRLGEAIAADESASLRDAIEMARLRFDSLYLICPQHNAVGPFDFAGAYDEASDRRQDVPELMERAYEDAYRQFIDPVVGASGEHLARATSGPQRAYLRDGEEPAHADDYTGLLDDRDPSR
jgi:hypothetical protein